MIKKLLLPVLFTFISSIAVGADYYVSNKGDDSKSGTSPENAWQTLNKVNSFTPSPGDRILFERGGKWVGTITVKASGTSANPIVYGAYGSGAKPKIYGSEEITGWTRYSGSIYKATFTKEVEQLFIDGKRMRLARYPNAGYFEVSSTNGSTTVSSTSLNESIDYAGATLFGRITGWNIYSETVDRSNSGTLILESAINGIDKGEGFWLANKLEFLDSEGEWYYDNVSNTLYFWAPEGASPANHNILGSVFDYGFEITSYDHIIIQDFDLLHNALHGIYSDNGDFVKITQTSIIYPEQFGIYIPSTGSTNTTITYTLVDGANRSGIHINSPNSVITDNIVKNIALHENFNKKAGDFLGMGIYSRSGDCSINYNRVLNTAYAGIHFWGERTMIKYNYIDNAMSVLSDGGGIYTYNGPNYADPAVAGSEIMNNIILNCRGNREGYTNDWDDGYGIYMDDNTRDVKIHGNTVSGCNCGIYLHNAGNIDVRNNDISNCTLMAYNSGENAQNFYIKNTFYAFDNAGDFIWWQNSSQRFVKEENSHAVFDNNYYVHNYTKSTLFGNSDSFTDWQVKTGQDNNSTFRNSTTNGYEREKLFYNDTKDSVLLNLGNLTFFDVFGNVVSGIVSLPPFTSIILTGEDMEKINKSPVISNQSFSVVTPKHKNANVGRIVAYDPDINQNLQYQITAGNIQETFTIDNSTGEIFVSRDIELAPEAVIELTVSVTDNANFPLSSASQISINLIPGVDLLPPVVTSFVIPSEHYSPEIPIKGFSVSDNGHVVGFGITANPTPPAENEWLSSPPSSFFFPKEGITTIFAWAKDTTGNISEPVEATVTLAFPDTVQTRETVYICQGKNYKGWTETGNYEHYEYLNKDTIQLVLTELIVEPPYRTFEEVFLTEGEDYLGWTEPGTYERMLKTPGGCDSIVVTQLDLLPVDEAYLSYFEWSRWGRYKRDTGRISSSNETVKKGSIKKIDFLTIYPNPANTYVILNIKTAYLLKSKIQIVDINGKIVASWNINSFEERVDLTGLPNGTYYVKTETSSEQTFIEKLLIY